MISAAGYDWAVRMVRYLGGKAVNRGVVLVWLVSVWKRCMAAVSPVWLW